MMRVLVLALALALVHGVAAARPAFTPEIGSQLDERLEVRDAGGTTATLAEVLSGKPALVIFGYDKCPNLCGVTQSAVALGLDQTGLEPDGYRALFVSIDPTETEADARAAKSRLAEAAEGASLVPWRFLTGPGDAGGQLAAEAGLEFERRDRIGQYVYPVSIIVLTPDARISRVLPAMSFQARDLRLALVEASEGRLGSIAEHVFLLCAGFDTTKGQYTPVVQSALQVAGVGTVLVLAVVILVLARRRGRR